MELKVRSDGGGMGRPQPRQNPFNGIERVEQDKSERKRGIGENPFNGIESSPPTFKPKTLHRHSMNPFNGIESLLGLRTVPSNTPNESIQWNWKDD